MLRFHGAAVTPMVSGRAALNVLRRLQFDALVCDLRMPDVDGYELIRAVRGTPSPSHNTHAIAITVYGESEHRAKALAAGFDDYVPKLSSVALVARLSTLKEV
jgi:CheY-like chemotaxis protein